MTSHQEFIDAIKAGNIVQVEALLAANPSLAGVTSENGLSAVLLAAYYGQAEIARLLAAQHGALTIFEAAAVGDLERVRTLVETRPDLVNAYAGDGFQPLGLAAFFGHRDIAALLLEHGAEVNSASRNDMHVMPLHSAAASRSVEIARLLLDHGADPDAAQADEFTPLHAAAQNGQIEMIRLLLDHGAEINARAVNGKTPLAYALDEGHILAADLLRERGGAA